MRNLVFALSLVLLFALPSSAQLVISVDTSISRNAEKSVITGMALSLAIPGMGQKYLGEDKRVKPYVWTEVLGWSTMIASWFVGDAYLRSAQSYASHHAGVKNPPKDADFLDLMSRYRSRAGIEGQNSNPDLKDNYNMFMIRSDEEIIADYPDDASHTWDWGPTENPENSDHMREYDRILQNYRISRIVFQVSIGVVVLNRLVSMVDVLRIYRATSNNSLAFVPNLTPNTAGADLIYSF